MAGQYAKYRVTAISKKAKDEFFGDRKVIIHPVTRTEVFADPNAAQRKVGAALNSRHTVDMDHTLPIDRLAPVMERIPTLSEDDITNIINTDSNKRMLPSHLNRSKQARTNWQLALDREVPLRGKVVLAKWDIEARVGVPGKTAATVAKNVARAAAEAGQEFADAARGSLEDAAIPLMVEGVHKLYQVAAGDKEFEEAAREMGRLTVEVAATGGAMQVVATGVEKALASTSSTVLKNLANSNQVTQMITFAFTVKDSVIKYVNGDLDGEQFFRAIGEDGVKFYAGVIGASLGQALIPIPVVGALIGSLVVSTACGALLQARQALIDAYRSLDEFDARVARVNGLATRALAEMEQQRIHLKDLIETHFAHWDAQVQLGFDEMYQSTLRNDAEGIAHGLDRVARLFDQRVAFKTVDEFADFLADPTATLKL